MFILEQSSKCQNRREEIVQCWVAGRDRKEKVMLFAVIVTGVVMRSHLLRECLTEPFTGDRLTFMTLNIFPLYS